MVIGLFIQMDWHWHWPKIWPIVAGAVHAARSRGVRLLIYSDPGLAGRPTGDFENLPRDFGYAEPLIDGFIFTFPDAEMRRYAQALKQAGTPVVLIGRRAGDVPRVMAENARAFRELVARMVARGHRDIVFIEGPADNLCAVDRLAGYRQGMEAAGLPVPPTLRFEGGPGPDAARAAIRERLRNGPPFTAVLCFDDVVAFGVLDELRRAGRRVPEDVEVVGFDNVPGSRWCQPPLSTYEMQAFRLGHTAAEAAIRAASGETLPLETAITPEYLPRGSTRDPVRAGTGRFRLLSDWTEGAFDCAAQMQRLQALPDAAAFLRRLREQLTADELVEIVRGLIRLAAEARVSVAVLYPVIDTAMADLTRVDGERVRAVFDQLSSAAVDEQRQRIEVGIRFNASSIPLRESALAVTRDDVVIEQLRRVLSDLRVRHAALILNQDDADARGSGRWWDFARVGGAAEPVSGREFQTLLEWHPEVHAFAVMPLHYKGRQLGLVAVDAEAEAVVHFPDLVGQLSIAFHGVRMHRALERANQELVETSRLAGIAEMATGVLHNIGNALNSVNTSANVAADRLRRSKAEHVSKVAALLAENTHRLPEFLTQDPRGSLLVDYLRRLGTTLENERAQGLGELHDLCDKIEHLNEIVASQQGYANAGTGIIEDIEVGEVVEHALRISLGGESDGRLWVERNVESGLVLRVSRHKVLQILVNLLRNAREAVDQSQTPEPHLRLRARRVRDGVVEIAVEDNGSGIEPENLTRIFAFGFTTKPEGHGFGLHSSALAAREMGGTLVARSDGPGRGATFLLELPATH